MFKKIIVILIFGFAASASFAEERKKVEHSDGIIAPDVVKIAEANEAYKILETGKIIYSERDHFMEDWFDTWNYNVLEGGYFWQCIFTGSFKYEVLEGLKKATSEPMSYSFRCYAYKPQPFYDKTD